MGNSEVGHLNLGAGPPGAPGPAADRRRDRRRLVLHRPALLAACERAKRDRPAARGRAVGPGGVHAHDRAPRRARGARRAARRPVACASTRCSTAATRHPRSALGFVRDLEARLAAVHPDARIATVGGRYCAMDRDQRWERTERGYDAIVHAEGARTPRRRPRPSRPATPAARPTSSSRPTVIDGTGRRRSATATRSSTSTSAPTARGS